MQARNSNKMKTLFIYPGSENPYISVRGLRSEPPITPPAPESVEFAKIEFKSSHEVLRDIPPCYSSTSHLQMRRELKS